jgi:hypothetical protein
METKAPENGNELDAISYPNPSITSFSIIVKTATKEKIVMQVFDVNGKLIETRNVNAQSITKFGDNYRSGAYLVRVLQGKKHKEIKLVKLPD